MYLSAKKSFAIVITSLTLIAAVGCNQETSTGCVPYTAAEISAHFSSESFSHIPAVVATYTDEGKIAETDTTSLPVTIALALNHEDELDQRVAEMYQPGHPNFHKFVTPEEFRERYAPTAEQIADVKNYLANQGIRATEAGGFILHAEASAETLGTAFQTELHAYRDRSGARHFAPAREPKFPAGLGIRAVHGLHDSAKLRSFAHFAAQPNDGTGPGNAMLPTNVKSAYNIPTSVNGAGQTIALVELDGYYDSDITAYSQAVGIPSISVQNVMVDGYSGAAGSGAAEVTLDIELAAAIAPGAKVMVYEATNTSQALLDIYTRIANDDAASQVSVSWGSTEAQTSAAFLQSENAVLKQMAAQGQAVFVASGDSGAYDNGTTLGVGDPASQPFVVAVGGTRLNASGGTYLSETTWNGGSPSAGAGGGGVSAAWTQPSWQNGVSTAQNLVSSKMRNVPEVSLNADPDSGYAIVYQGAWITVGGTSCAAPIWAAFLALVNEQRTASGMGALGFPNPAIYSIGKSSRYAADFHDVRDGSNNLYYPSVSGFDDATGWGSFNGQALFEDLSKEPSASNEQLSC